MKRAPFFFCILLVSGLTSCKSDFFEPEPGQDPEAIFEYLWLDFKQHYGPSDARNVNWDSLYAVFRPQVTATTTEEELFAVCTALFEPLNDGHVQMTTPGRPVYYSNRFYRERIGTDLFDLEVITGNYLKGAVFRDPDQTYLYGMLNDSIVYLHFPYVGPNFRVFSEVLERYPRAKGMVIDLRHNEGGDFTYSYKELATFNDRERLVCTSQTKNGPGEDDFTPVHTWYLDKGKTHFPHPLKVLTDRYTLSAGERTVMALDVLPQVTLMGDTTNGGHSTMIGRALANGWFYTLPTQRVWMADGLSREGVGIPPDVRVVNSRTELDQGKDAVLDAALADF